MDNIQKYTDYLGELDRILTTQSLGDFDVQRFKETLLTQELTTEDVILRQVRDFANEIINELNRQKNALKDGGQLDSQEVFESQKALLDLQHANQRFKDNVESFDIDNVVRKITTRLNTQLKENAARLSEFYNNKTGLQSELSAICTQVVHSSIRDQLSLMGVSIETMTINSLNSNNQQQIQECAKKAFGGQDELNQSIVNKIVTEILNFLEEILPQKFKNLLVGYRKNQFRLQLEQTSFPKFHHDVRDKIKISVEKWFREVQTKKQQAFDQEILQKQQEIDSAQSAEQSTQQARQKNIDSLNVAYKQILQLTEKTLY